jgi:hypothetical protein
MSSRHEAPASPSVYARVTEANIQQVKQFTENGRKGFATLALVDPEDQTVELDLPECDIQNRHMLDVVYTELGLDPEMPAYTRETKYSNGGTVHERAFRIANMADIFERTSSQPNPSTGEEYRRFAVKVEQTQSL